MHFPRFRSFAALTLLVASLFCSCSSGSPSGQLEAVTKTAALPVLIPGMPPYPDPSDVYSAGRPGLFSDTVKGMPSRVYVPCNVANKVMVIDPATYKVIDEFPVEREPQHVTPSYDLKTLYVGNDQGNTLTVIDPMTGKKTDTLKIEDPYNLYFTPDGKYAIVVAERLRRLDFRDPKTMKLIEQVKAPCRGVDHMDFSMDGRYALATCEFSGEMLKVDTVNRKVIGKLSLPNGGMPQDVKISPDGKTFYVADMENDGMYVIDGDKFVVTGFMATGKGCHGLYTSRDSKLLYISNRNEGSVSVMEFATRKLVAKWQIPGGGSPDMGGVSADGKVLWLSGRYHKEVYAISTTDGNLLARIPVARGPHGMCVWPQPGRYSIGHTGILR
ncbi:MAG: YncE family protein [Bryobacterales bacterium]|nr:YncE family protein [Bryobacterales bacterium]